MALLFLYTFRFLFDFDFFLCLETGLGASTMMMIEQTHNNYSMREGKT